MPDTSMGGQRIMTMIRYYLAVIGTVFALFLWANPLAQAAIKKEVFTCEKIVDFDKHLKLDDAEIKRFRVVACNCVCEESCAGTPADGCPINPVTLLPGKLEHFSSTFKFIIRGTVEAGDCDSDTTIPDGAIFIATVTRRIHPPDFLSDADCEPGEDIIKGWEDISFVLIDPETLSILFSGSGKANLGIKSATFTFPDEDCCDPFVSLGVLDGKGNRRDPTLKFCTLRIKFIADIDFDVDNPCDPPDPEQDHYVIHDLRLEGATLCRRCLP